MQISPNNQVLITSCLKSKAAQDSLMKVGVSKEKSVLVVASLKKSVDRLYPQLSLTQKYQLILDKVFDSAEMIAMQLNNRINLSTILKNTLKKAN